MRDVHAVGFDGCVSAMSPPVVPYPSRMVIATGGGAWSNSTGWWWYKLKTFFYRKAFM